MEATRSQNVCMPTMAGVCVGGGGQKTDGQIAAARHCEARGPPALPTMRNILFVLCIFNL